MLIITLPRLLPELTIVAELYSIHLGIADLHFLYIQLELISTVWIQSTLRFDHSWTLIWQLHDTPSDSD